MADERGHDRLADGAAQVCERRMAIVLVSIASCSSSASLPRTSWATDDRHRVMGAAVLLFLVVAIGRIFARPMSLARIAAARRRTRSSHRHRAARWPHAGEHDRRCQPDALSKLGVVVVAMFGFGYALVPFYEQICEATGLRNIDARRRGRATRRSTRRAPCASSSTPTCASCRGRSGRSSRSSACIRARSGR